MPKLSDRVYKFIPHLFWVMLLCFFHIGIANGLDNMKASKAPLLVTDAAADQTLPNKLRILPNYHGIAGIVGSAQFNETGLAAIVAKIQAHHPKKKIWLVDLRQETHFFANGQPLSFYGYHNSANIEKSSVQILQEESQIIADFQKKSELTTVNLVIDKKNGEITKTRPIQLNLQNSQSEEELAKKYELSYKRFYITDHKAPTPEVQKELTTFINQIDADDWVIVHCRGGKGRTTTFMLLTAILKDQQLHKKDPTFKIKSVQEYIEEQISLGGTNLFNTDDSNDALWQKENKKHRAKFIEHFYQQLP